MANSDNLQCMVQGKTLSYKYNKWIKEENPLSRISDAMDLLENRAIKARADDAMMFTTGQRSKSKSVITFQKVQAVEGSGWRTGKREHDSNGLV